VEGSVLKPVLIVIAGPNGSGKTTFTPLVIEHDWSEGCLFINPDEIAENEFGDWNSPDAVMKAAVRAQELREQCLAERRSMLLETVCSIPEKIEFIQRAKDAGFFVRFFFIGTDTPQINASRVVRRMLEGGHEVPLTKIISRYSRSMANAVLALAIADRGYVYDNSIDNQNPKPLFRTKDGHVFKTYPDLKHHPWGKMVYEEVNGLAGDIGRAGE
jgi:predicted ABC-type ATPase